MFSDLLPIIDAPMEPGEIFRLVLPLDLCPSANSACWRNKSGHRLRKIKRDGVAQHILLTARWRTQNERAEARNLCTSTKLAVLKPDGKSRSAKGARDAVAGEWSCKRLREVRVTRASSSQPDPTALIEQLKLPIDEMVVAGVLWDDSSRYMRLGEVKWQKAPPSSGWVKIGVFEVSM